jgi:hypothetical protein
MLSIYHDNPKNVLFDKILKKNNYELKCNFNNSNYIIKTNFITENGKKTLILIVAYICPIYNLKSGTQCNSTIQETRDNIVQKYNKVPDTHKHMRLVLRLRHTAHKLIECRDEYIFTAMFSRMHGGIGLGRVGGIGLGRVGGIGRPLRTYNNNNNNPNNPLFNST